jgi:DNA-binding PadR family transcriptional regulator
VHKLLLILGLLRSGPRTGYDLHRIVRAHGELYRDLKRSNIYFLLDRLARDGDLDMCAEPGARGPRGEWLVYSITKQGRERFDVLLREVLTSYELSHTGVEVAVAFLSTLDRRQAVGLLEERRARVRARREHVVEELAGGPRRGPLAEVAVDHLLGLIDAELAWIGRSLRRLAELDWRVVRERTSRDDEIEHVPEVVAAQRRAGDH